MDSRASGTELKIPSLTENLKIETGQAEIFFLFTLNTTALPVLPKMDAKKAANLFQNLLLHVLPLSGGLFNFGIGWGGSTSCCRPLSAYQQRQPGLSTAGAARSS